METNISVKENEIVTILPEQWAEYAQYCNDHNLYPLLQCNNQYLICANKPDLVRPIREQIYYLKQKLADTDYQAIKFAEGAISAAEFSDTREQRKVWRLEINRLEAELETVSAKN